MRGYIHNEYRMLSKDKKKCFLSRFNKAFGWFLIFRKEENNYYCTYTNKWNN